MQTPQEFVFWIDAYSPATIPMERLAAYMQKLAILLGNYERVHFDHLQGGSTAIAHRVEWEALPKVRQRVGQVAHDDGPEDAIEAYRELNDMLRTDNAVAELREAKSNLLRFPGREVPKPQKIGPFKQHAELDGVLVRIGGKDVTAHATLEDVEGKTFACEVSRSLAKEMAHFLFGKTLRVSGTARWERTDEGEWHLSKFVGESFIQLNDDDLQAAVEKLRGIDIDFQPGAQELMRQLRADDSEYH